MPKAKAMVIGLVLALGCGGHSTSAPTPKPEPNQTADILLVVTNHNWQDITVLASHDGVTERVGLVLVGRTASFAIPARMVISQGPFHLIADPIGDPNPHVSDNILVQPGQEITWILEDNLARSSLTVY